MICIKQINRRSRGAKFNIDLTPFFMGIHMLKIKVCANTEINQSIRLVQFMDFSITDCFLIVIPQFKNRKKRQKTKKIS